MSNEKIDAWVRLAKRRSSENSDAMAFFVSGRSMSGAFGILRQELDTLVRAMFLLRQRMEVREMLISQTLSGEKWRLPDGSLITDREMVDLATELEGWSEYVYKLGCAFIHLSDLHSGEDADLAARLSEEQVRDIQRYVRHYHGVEISDDVRLAELFAVSSGVFRKISGNLDCYLDHIADDEADIV